MRARAETSGRGASPSSGATRQILAGVTMAAMLCGVGLLHVAAKVGALEAGYRLGKVEESHRQLERENVALKLQLATMRSAAHIETQARTQLGMAAPAPQMIFAVGGPVTPVVKAPVKPAKKPAPKPVAKVAPHAPTGGTPVAMLAPERR